MSEIQPSNTDAILGGQNCLTTDTVVLGGIEGIKQRLTSQDEEIQKSALRAALTYEDKGLELLIDVWRNDSYKLKWQAFSLLRTREEGRVKHALSEYNPWLNMSCIHSWEQDSIAESIAIAPDGNTLFSGNEEEINVWDMQTNQQKSTSFPYHGTRNLIVTPDGKSLISRGGHISTISDDGHNYSSPRGITSWNINTGENISVAVAEYSSAGFNLVISHCQQFIIHGNENRQIMVSNLKTGKPAKNFKDSKGIMYDLAISAGGENLVGCGRDRTVKIWDIKTRELKSVLKHKEIVRSVAISPDDRTLVSGSRDKTVKVWNLQAHKIKFTLKGHDGWIYFVAISPDGNYIFSCSSDKTIRVWDLHTGECVSVLTGHTELIHCLVVSPDGKTLVSSSRDKTIKIWQRQF
jgi:COMPASS component SWD3